MILLHNLLARVDALTASMDSFETLESQEPRSGPVQFYMRRTIKGHQGTGGFVPRPSRIGSGAELKDLTFANVGFQPMMRTKV